MALTDVTVASGRGSHAPDPETLAAVDAAVRQAVARDPGWGLEGEGREVLAGRLDARVEAVPHAGERLGLRLSLAFTAARRSQLAEPVETVGTAMATAGESVGARVETLAAEGLASLTAQIALLQGDDRGVLRALSAEDAAVRRLALREAQSRQLREAAPVLRERLGALDVAGDTTDHREFVAIVGALSSLGDRAAVPMIIDAVPLAEGALLVAIMPALARLGGADAAAFLEVVATGHALPAVREAARRAREDMVGAP